MQRFRWRSWLPVGAVAGGLIAGAATSASAQLVIEVHNDHFHVNGQQKFLTFISYFDALDSNDIAGDLQYVKNAGFDGVRVFPNWMTTPGQCFAGDTLIRADGTLNLDTLTHLKRDLLDVARQIGLIVDLTFTADTIKSVEDCSPPGNITFASYKAGLKRVAQELRADEYRHVIFDVQNEFTHGAPFNGPSGQFMSPAQIADLINTVHAADADPNRLAFVSIVLNSGLGVPDVPSVRTVADNTGSQIVTYHEPRTPWVPPTTDINTLRGAGHDKPAYLQEPDKWYPGSGYTTGTFQNAVNLAKQYGAAAWTFHNDAAHVFNTTPPNGPNLVSALTARANSGSPEKAFVESFIGSLNATSWGVAPDAPTCPPSCPPPPNTPNAPGYSAIPDYTGDGFADLGNHHRASGQFWIRANNQNGTFAPDGVNWGSGVTITPTAGWETLVGDFTGDGLADYADRHLASGQVWVHRNLGNGSFAGPGDNWASGVTTTGPTIEVLVGDMDHDGRADLIEHDRLTGTFMIRRNMGPTTDAFQPVGAPITFHSQIGPGGSNWRSIAADFNGDGFVDIVDYYIPASRFWVHFNVGGYQFSDWSWGPYDAFVWSQFTTIFGDFNGDHCADYVDLNTANAELWVHAGNCAGSFSPSNDAHGYYSRGAGGFWIMGVPVSFPYP